MDDQSFGMMAEQDRKLLWLIANLEPLCVNPSDGAPFEDGEVPYIDEARTLIRLNQDLLLREAGVRFLDDMASVPDNCGHPEMAQIRHADTITDTAEELMDAASRFAVAARRAGPTTDYYWAACERLEEALVKAGKNS